LNKEEFQEKLKERTRKDGTCQVRFDQDDENKEIPCPLPSDSQCERCHIDICWSHKVEVCDPLFGEGSVSECYLCPGCASDLIQELAAEVWDMREWHRMRGQSVSTERTILKKNKGKWNT